MRHMTTDPTAGVRARTPQRGLTEEQPVTDPTAGVRARQLRSAVATATITDPTNPRNGRSVADEDA